jgi:hypothetical protein
MNARPRLRDTQFALAVLTWLAALLAVVARRCRRSPVSRFVASAALICALGLGIAACGGGTYSGGGGGGGGGDPATPTGTYTITVTGTANGTAQPLNLTLIVD